MRRNSSVRRVRTYSTPCGCAAGARENLNRSSGVPSPTARAERGAGGRPESAESQSGRSRGDSRRRSRRGTTCPHGPSMIGVLIRYRTIRAYSCFAILFDSQHSTQHSTIRSYCTVLYTSCAVVANANASRSPPRTPHISTRAHSTPLRPWILPRAAHAINGHEQHA